MKLYEIVNAVTALRRLITQEMSLKTAYRLNLLVNQLNLHLDYFNENRERIAKLADQGDSELDELLQEDVSATIEKVKIQLNEAVRLSAADIMQLEGFIEFVDESDKKSDIQED